MNRRFAFFALGVAGLALLLAPQFGVSARQQLKGGSGLGIGGTRPPSGTWAPLTNQPPNNTTGTTYFTASEMFLMTDGSVLCMAADSSYDFSTASWYTDPSVWKLTPDINGSYANGTWSQVASMNHSRLYFGSSVLADGRLIVCGGEYADGSTQTTGGVWTNECEIYDPVANTWTELSPPSGWNNIGDAPCMVLPNEKFLLGSDFNTSNAIFDPSSNSWSPAASIPSADQNQDESAWALMPNGRVLVVSCFGHPDSLYYDYTTDSWTDAGNLPTDLVDPGSLELGAANLLPNGKVFVIGATPGTCIYTPSSNTWVNGPMPPSVSVNGTPTVLTAPDAPAAMMPNGKVLMAMTPYSPGGYGNDTNVVEFDGTNYAIGTTPPLLQGAPPYVGRFLVLPTGQILCTASGDSDAANNTVYIYTPDGTYQSAWQPTISSVASTLHQGSANNPLTGTQLNGISQGSAYGDDSTNFTNYPIVRIQNVVTGHISYCKTHNHSTMAVATGSAVVSTQFDIPVGVETGPSYLYVVANGIPSAAQPVNVVAPHVVLPSGYSLFRGVANGGGLGSLFFADGSTLNALVGPTLNTSESPIQVVITGTSPTATPTSFQLMTTSKMNSPGTSQSISLWNYSTGAYDVLDTRSISTSNLTVTVTASGTLSHYVGAGGAVQARISYKQTGPTTTPHWGTLIDLANWIIQ
ncbi:MAG TPA: kelch repeat-containing protein [Fimbriimonadaceae bacterium]|nr:kelch repeat-containing protein [Fimbriimonadaceae bacterium]